MTRSVTSNRDVGCTSDKARLAALQQSDSVYVTTFIIDWTIITNDGRQGQAINPETRRAEYHPTCLLSTLNVQTCVSQVFSLCLEWKGQKSHS